MQYLAGSRGNPAKETMMNLVFFSESPMGNAALFEQDEMYTLYYKKHGFLPAIIQTEEIEGIKDALVGKRLMTAGGFNSRFDPETPPVEVHRNPAEENDDLYDGDVD